MSDRIEAEILDALGEEVDAAIDTPLVVIEGTKGEPGADGITPTIGSNGNWFLGATDTGKPSRGATGAPVRTALRRTSAAMATGTSAAQTPASRLVEPLARRVMQVQPALLALLVLLGLPVRPARTAVTRP